MKEKRQPDLVTIALRKVGLNPKFFAPDTLGVTYQMFRYRIREGRLTLEDYHKILFYTGKQFSDLWPSPFDTSHKPIALNLNKSSVPVSRSSPPKEEKKPEEVPVSTSKIEVQPAPTLKKSVIIDVYDGALPTDEAQEY